ncbi:MAG: hypothetical protein QOI16_407, partial [Pseudonocardiales bacterium]|nr:hypothetical protein [Pseudonocardiales bacterium]
AARRDGDSRPTSSGGGWRDNADRHASGSGPRRDDRGPNRRDDDRRRDNDRGADDRRSSGAGSYRRDDSRPASGYQRRDNADSRPPRRFDSEGGSRFSGRDDRTSRDGSSGYRRREDSDSRGGSETRPPRYNRDGDDRRGPRDRDAADRRTGSESRSRGGDERSRPDGPRSQEGRTGDVREGRWSENWSDRRRKDSAGGSDGRDSRSDRPAFVSAPPLSDSIVATALDPAARRDLLGLQKDLAEAVARHLVAAGSLVDEDPQAALAHARYARRRASRIAVVREAAGIAAYHAGEWAEALAELRAARRMGGGPGHLAVMADVERAMGRPERAIEVARGPEARELGRDTQVELAIVVAGARRDLGELDAAVVGLQIPELDPTRRDPWSARLFYAYADNLLAAGRESDALQWFVHAVDADADGQTDADVRVAELTGEPLPDEGIEFGLDDEHNDEADPEALDATAADDATPDDETASATALDEATTDDDAPGDLTDTADAPVEVATDHNAVSEPADALDEASAEPDVHVADHADAVAGPAETDEAQAGPAASDDVNGSAHVDGAADVPDDLTTLTDVESSVPDRTAGR